MKRVVTFAIIAFMALIVASIPHSTATSNLVESGTTHNFDSTVVFSQVLEDNTLLILQGNGIVISATSQNGIISELWTFDLAVNASFAKLDSGEKLLAVIHDQGFLSFNMESQQIEYDTQLSSIPDSLDWDSDGNVWVSYHGGLRKAREYSGGSYTNFQTDTVQAGFLSFHILDNNNMVVGGFDSKLHIFDEYGNLLSKKTEPTAYVSSLYEPHEGLLLAGSGNGDLHSYDYNNSWAHAKISVASSQIKSIQNFDDNTYAAIDSDNNIHFIDKTSFTKTGELSSVTTTHFAISELTGQISVIYNSGGSGAVMYYDIDGDGDGVIDSLDDFPTDSSQQYDSDGDGYGDNLDGSNADLFPNNPEQHADSDGDGYGDNEMGQEGDLFPDNSEQWADLDNDGYGDNPDGLMGDKFPEDSTQWNDTDGDGYGDNPQGNTPDSCPTVAGFSTIDRYGCIDTDFDFYSNPDESYTIADGADALPNDGTQWFDLDGDGFGDNPAPASNPDSCPSVAGNSTQEIRIDGAIIEKLGCLDSDGDSFEDISDEFPSDKTEWFDGDGDGTGSNSDYDDSEFLIVTQEDYCRISGNQSNSCKQWNDLDYQDYLSRDKADGETDLSYPAWLAQKDSLQGDEDGLMSTVKDVALVGGGVFIGVTVLILLVSFVAKRRKLNKLVKRYGVPFQPKDKGTANEEALEGTAGLSATGGIDSDDSWDDEIEAMDFSEKSNDIEEVAENVISAEELYDDETDISGLAGIDVTPSQDVEPDVSALTSEENDSTVEQKPTSAPPLPASGLPEGWTMEQWEWYGHEWLQKFGGN